MTRIDELDHCSWQCIHFIQGMHAPKLTQELHKRLIKAFIVDVVDVKCDTDLFLKLSKSINFPEYFGNNWDALDEVLVDMDVGAGCVCILFGASELWRNATLTGGRLIEAWQTAAEQWGKEDLPFHLIFVV